jgi:hypothetical protein
VVEEVNIAPKDANGQGDEMHSPNQHISQDLSGLIKDGLSEVSRGWFFILILSMCPSEGFS